MGNQSAIQWTNATWNPLRGCSKVSAGCTHCYAETFGSRFSGEGKPWHGFVKDGRWTGRVELIESKLEEPLRWQKPRLVFVNSMSDLFHESLSDKDIDRVFAVMALSPRHTFQVLTKRPARMRAYMERGAAWDAAHDDRPGHKSRRAAMAREHGGELRSQSWPLPNVWLGTSIEDQNSTDSRVGHLIATPAAVRFVSAEPLLGRVQLAPYLYAGKDSLKWVICGGESGTGARKCDVAWIRAIVAQCKAAGVPVFVKQLGSNAVSYELRDDGTRMLDIAWNMHASHPKAGDPSEWPEDLRVREFPEASTEMK